MQARYYDPNQGRFLSIDPVTFLDTGEPSYFNRYRYCSNDPINCTDPTGKSDAFGTTDSILFEVVAYAFQPVIDALDPRTIPDDIATTIDEVKSGDLSGAALSAGGVAFRPLKGAKGALKQSEAATERAKSIKKGVPESKIGPSGKPKQHTVKHSSRKSANQAAKKEANSAGGKVRNDANPSNPQQGPHFQAEDAAGNNVKPVVHHERPKP